MNPVADLPSEVVAAAMAGLGLVALIGAGLARAGRYRAHGICQSAAFALTVVLVLGWMLPTYRGLYAEDVARGIVNRVNVAVAVHALLGAAVVLCGLWVVLVAGTSLVPARLRFASYRAWMRTLLAAWWLTIALGIVSYVLARS
jgi:uncharacterized membrane protein YozB (DUF420 family)